MPCLASWPFCTLDWHLQACFQHQVTVVAREESHSGVYVDRAPSIRLQHNNIPMDIKSHLKEVVYFFLLVHRMIEIITVIETIIARAHTPPMTTARLASVTISSELSP